MARYEADYLIHLLVAHRDHQDGLAFAFGAQLLAHVEASDVGQARVKQDQMDGLHPNRVERGLAGRARADDGDVHDSAPQCYLTAHRGAAFQRYHLSN